LIFRLAFAICIYTLPRTESDDGASVASAFAVTHLTSFHESSARTPTMKMIALIVVIVVMLGFISGRLQWVDPTEQKQPQSSVGRGSNPLERPAYGRPQ
jgi:hypothetical protein